MGTMLVLNALGRSLPASNLSAMILLDGQYFKETIMKMWKVFRGHSVMTSGLLAAAFVFAPLGHATLMPRDGSTTLSALLCPEADRLLASVEQHSYYNTVGDTLTVTYSEYVYQEMGGTLDFIIQATNTGRRTGLHRQCYGLGFRGQRIITTNVGFNASAPLGSTISGGIDPMRVAVFRRTAMSLDFSSRPTLFLSAPKPTI